MYYPLSQVTTDLYTNGGEFFISKTNQPYKGYYWKNSKNQFFTGKTPQDTPTEELTKAVSNINNTPNETSSEYIDYASNYESLKYNQLQKITQKQIQLPLYYITFPTEKDYQIGEFRRYFCKRINNNIYLEISKDTFDRLTRKDSTIAYQLFIGFDIPWQLTGNEEQAYKTNKNIVELTSKKLKLSQFNKYLKEDYTKYYQEPIIYTINTEPIGNESSTIIPTTSSLTIKINNASNLPLVNSPSKFPSPYISYDYVFPGYVYDGYVA